MDSLNRLNAILFIRPNAEFVINGDELNWLDKKQTKPTESEIEAGLVAYEAKIQADKIEAEAKKQALLDRLGITAEEARLLLS